MRILISCHVVDANLAPVANVLRPVFMKLAGALDGDYGGMMEHLWVALEMTESGAKADGSARFLFRFQKRVSGRSRFGLNAIPDSFNVGHFSVRPELVLLDSLVDEGTEAKAIPYALRLIHDTASAVLPGKQEKLGGFDAGRFLARFRTECARLGFPIDT